MTPFSGFPDVGLPAFTGPNPVEPAQVVCLFCRATIQGKKHNPFACQQRAAR